MTALRAVARPLAVALTLVLAVIAQLAVVNRAPLPGGATPDLVLLMVTAVAVRTGPATGMLIGFAGGLALDIAPPAAHLAGEYALVFCLAGYACGRASNMITHARGELTMVTSLTVMALGTAAGEAGKAALGLLLSDPDVTRPAVRHVLPAAIVYDLLLSPFAAWLVSLILRSPAPERAPRPELTRIATPFRAASAGAVGGVPRLRLAGSTPPQTRPPARPEPKLHLASGRSSPLSGTYAAFSPTPHPLPGGRPVKLNFSQNGHAPAGQRQPTTPGKGWLRAGRPAGAVAPRRTSPPEGWLRASRPAHSTASVRRTSPPKGWLRASRPGHPTGLASPRRTSPGKGWLRTGRPAGPAVRKRRSPGKRWLRPARPVPAPKPAQPPKGWIRPAKPVPLPKRKSPGKRWIRPAKPARRGSYGTSPSSRWVRRSRSHSRWHGRRRRLLSLMGGRR